MAERSALLSVFTSDELAAAVSDGRLRRIARARYSTLDADEIRVQAASVGGVISGLSAARWWGWGVKRDPARTVVTVPRNRPVARPDLDVRRRDLPPHAVVDGFVMSKPYTVVDCARTLPFDEALAVADSALRDPTVTRADLVRAADASPRSGRPRVQRVVRLADARADNPFESCVRAFALDVPGLDLVPQVQVGHVGWADLVDVRLRIVVECDSWAYHSGEDLFRRDVRRYTDMVRQGWLVVRFVWEDAMAKPDRIRDTLTDVVRLRAQG